MANPRGGIEIFYDYSNPTDNLAVRLFTNVKGVAQYQDPVYNGYNPIDLAFYTQEISGETHVFCELWLGGILIDRGDYNLNCPLVEKISNRIVFADTSVIVYTNGVGVYSYSFVSTDWPPKVYVSAGAIGGDVSLNVTNAELCDPREAVYIDYESTADSALQSIIQQRPIQIFAQVGRANAFTYSATRQEMAAHHIINLEEQTKDNANLASDGLVYYSDVGINISELTAAQVGLVTKLFRLSELYNGAIQAAERMQHIAIEHRKVLVLTMRMDLRLEIADILDISTQLTGTGTRYSDQIIVEDITVALQNGSYSMRVTGRRKM